MRTKRSLNALASQAATGAVQQWRWWRGALTFPLELTPGGHRSCDDSRIIWQQPLGLAVLLRAILSRSQLRSRTTRLTACTTAGWNWCREPAYESWRRWRHQVGRCGCRRASDVALIQSALRRADDSNSLVLTAATLERCFSTRKMVLTGRALGGHRPMCP